MSEDNCRFELPKGWKEDTVYTKWVEVLRTRIEEKLIDEFLEDLMDVYEPYYDVNNKISKLYKKWETKKNE